jgi:hypothetical protein
MLNSFWKYVVKCLCSLQPLDVSVDCFPFRVAPNFFEVFDFFVTNYGYDKPTVCLLLLVVYV